LNTELIKAATQKDDEKQNKKQKDDNELPPNKGKLQADATVADQYIAYPTDNGLLNECRKQCEKFIDKLYVKNDKKGTKPRTYRRVIDKAFLSYSKTKKKRKSYHRKMARKLLECVKRDISHINNMLDIWEAENKLFPLNHKEQRMFWIINTCYEQQKTMYENKTHSHPHRIVSIFQPHVRAIPRGKIKSQIEFGSKLGVSLDHGFARINIFSWDVYNEGGDLIKQVEAYLELHGYYPELVQVDKIYATRENRKWLKDNSSTFGKTSRENKRNISPKTKKEKRGGRAESYRRQIWSR
jgi:IS5 family transposase